MISGDIIFGQCIYCTRYQGRKGKEAVCEAFPKGIPESILMGDFNHQQPYGDEELLFDLAEGAEDYFKSWLAVHNQMKTEELPEVDTSRTRRRRPYRSKD